jgi:flagellar hook protein FlgE
VGNFAIAMSGLEADLTSLNTIGNNLANLNTTAYKERTTSFEDLFYQQLGRAGSGDEIQVGAGTKVSGTASNFGEGTILPDADDNPTDVALDGNGFFMVEQNGQQSLTRAGNFQVASNGNLITQDGQLVLGYPAVSQAGGAAKATQNFSLSTNLDLGAVGGTTFTSQVQVFDSLGNSHLATVTFRKSVDASTAWDFSVTLPAGDATGVPVTSTGTLFFDASGKPIVSDINMAFPGLADGANTLIMTWNLDGLTQSASPSVNISSTQDGHAPINGAIDTSTNPQPIVIPVGATEGAQATQNISVTSNLNSGATIGTTFTTPVQLYDSLGQSQQATISYAKTGTNTWIYSVTLPTGAATGAPVNNTGTLVFDSNGSLTSPAGRVAGISFPGMADGASDLTFNWNLNDPSGNPTLTQLASANTNGPQQQDGFTSGNYQTITVDTSGLITAQFSNGQSATVGQLAVASVANVQGLVATGDNNFTTTAASGQATAGVAGTGGRGGVEDNALEQSNVNISAEFSNLIVAQRAFEANSKTMTTFDTISQDAIAMVL